MSSGTIETGLSSEAHNIHRALASLQEELEAIDYYHQRVDVSDDESLKAVLAHNRDDEMEEAGIGGPYALVLGKEPYKWLMAGEPNAYPLRERVQALVPGGIHWSPVLKGGALLSRRGGDFELTVGEDLAIGYKSHNAKEVDLFFTESFTFRVLEPAAAVALELEGQRK